MEPIKFPESNATLVGGNSDLYGRHVENLPVFQAHGQTVSCWRLTWRERLSVLFFGKVWLFAMGKTHPPIWLEGRKSAFDHPWTVFK